MYLSLLIFILYSMKIFFIILCIVLLWIYLVYFLEKRYMGFGTILFIFLSMVTLYFGSNKDFYRLILFQLYLCSLGLQDYKTYYISKIWGVFSLILTVCFFDSIHLSGILFSFIASLMYFCKQDWIGSADIGILFVLGLILGFERMFICVFIAIFIGLLFYACSNKKLIPFITCLCFGAYISILKGFTIWYMFYGILAL